jgi:septum formation protein
MINIVLASSSPRRRQILERARIPFELADVDVSESLDEELSPSDMVKVLSERKAAAAIGKAAKPSVIIGADTIVSIHGKILCKPSGKEEAFAMLKRLAGSRHSVYTGVTLIRMGERGEEERAYVIDTTTVSIRPLSDGEINAYIETGEPFGKAGAYAAQGIGSLLVERVDGDYNTVVGLPLVKIFDALKAWGIDLSELWAKVET